METQMIDETQMDKFMEKMLDDLGAAANAPLIIIGDRLNLFKTLAEKGSQTSMQLAENTSTDERYIREWLAAMATSDYVKYDSKTETFSMTPEQIQVFTNEKNPMYLIGGFYSLASIFADETKVTKAFKTGKGIDWGDHSSCLFCGVEKFFRPSYEANLISSWIPSLTGAEEKLINGCMVADIGCGHGISTMILAKAFPNSTFVGFDIHDKSIEHARNLAAEAGLSNVTFEISTAKTFPGTYDLIACFDCLHDMGDPAGAAAHVKQALKEDGSWMIVEPMAGDKLEDNMNPVGRTTYPFSAAICIPTSLSQEVGAALGAQAGEAKLSAVIREGGLTQVRRASETPFNIILEARM